MDLQYCKAELVRNCKAITGLLADLPPEMTTWRPADGKWSLLEITCHLADEEQEDFRPRIGATLKGEEWAPIDPEGWVISRNYAARDFNEALRNFIAERVNSVKWLGKHEAADWSIAKVHTVFGKITAGDLLSAWVAHDMIHIRQIIRTKLQYFERHNAGFSTKYAGEW